MVFLISIIFFLQKNIFYYTQKKIEYHFLRKNKINNFIYVLKIRTKNMQYFNIN